ncbi:MAG: glycosyltransferase [Fibrobacterota bacterium]|nr:glycosyltransferase [Fibrobacterota bacterium]
MKRILFIAYHFPPILGSSGYLRTLKFIRYLPDHGYKPYILTVNPRAYPSWSESQLAQVPKGVDVTRTFALDAQRHLSFKGRYLGFTSVPDRFSTWIPGAVIAGLNLIRRHKIDLLFSTYPIPSAHVIGGTLARLTGKPWMADFRDPMWDETDGPLSPVMSARKAIEGSTMERCSKALVCTDGMADLFRARYGDLAQSKVSVIPNGFDEQDFLNLERPPRVAGTPVTFMHAGLLEQADRDPVPFFKGVRMALDQGLVRSGGMIVDLLGTGNSDVYLKEIERLNLSGVIRFLPPQPYAKALQAMAASDILLLFQGPSCDPQIPAKFYEYLRIGRPIMAVTTQGGQTGKAVETTQSGRVVPWYDSAAIAKAIGEWASAVEKGQTLPSCDPVRATPFSRQNQARTLAAELATLMPRI